MLHYAMVVIGANDGSKIQATIREFAEKGPVLLVEPVEQLYVLLGDRFKDLPNVRRRCVCVTTEDGPVRFNRPNAGMIGKNRTVEQLGSLNLGHAAAHHADLAAHFEVAVLPGLSIQTLLASEQIDSLDTLVIDTEGHDADILLGFPFDRLVPKRIHFEYRHADAPFRIGRKLGQLLITLDVLGYRLSVIDLENMLAIHRSLT